MTICDHCGEQIQSADYTIRMYNFKGSYTDYYDLCEKCYKVIDKWLNNGEVDE